MVSHPADNAPSRHPSPAAADALSQPTKTATPPVSGEGAPNGDAPNNAAARRQRYISPDGIEAWHPPDSELTPAPQQSAAAPSAQLPDPAAPYWVPQGVELTEMPDGLKAAIAHVINPAYRSLVLEAGHGLLLSTGLTVTHLLWLEILDHLELSRSDLIEAVLGLPPTPRVGLIDRHLRLVLAKLKATELLMRLQQFKNQWRSPAGTSFTDRELERILVADKSDLPNAGK